MPRTDFPLKETPDTLYLAQDNGRIGGEEFAEGIQAKWPGIKPAELMISGVFCTAVEDRPSPYDCESAIRITAAPSYFLRVQIAKTTDAS